MLANRLLSIEVSSDFKETKYYQRLLTHATPPKVHVSESDLLAYIVEAETKIKSQLGSHKWAFITGEAMGNHPRAVLALALKGEIDQLKQDARDGEVRTLEDADAVIKGIQDRLSKVTESPQQKTTLQQPTSTLSSLEQSTVKSDEVEVPRIIMRR